MLSPPWEWLRSSSWFGTCSGNKFFSSKSESIKNILTKCTLNFSHVINLLLYLKTTFLSLAGHHRRIFLSSEDTVPAQFLEGLNGDVQKCKTWASCGSLGWRHRRCSGDIHGSAGDIARGKPRYNTQAGPANAGQRSAKALPTLGKGLHSRNVLCSPQSMGSQSSTLLSTAWGVWEHWLPLPGLCGICTVHCDLCWLDIFRSSLLLWGGFIWRKLNESLGRIQSAFRDCCLSLEDMGLFSTRNNYGHVWHLQQSLKNRTNTLPLVIISAVLFEINISWESGTLWLQSTSKHNRFRICGVNGRCCFFLHFCKISLGRHAEQWSLWNNWIR